MDGEIGVRFAARNGSVSGFGRYGALTKCELLRVCQTVKSESESESESENLDDESKE